MHAHCNNSQRNFRRRLDLPKMSVTLSYDSLMSLFMYIRGRTLCIWGRWKCVGLRLWWSEGGKKCSAEWRCMGNTSMHSIQRTIWPVALASINEVNLRRARLVLRWATMSGFNSRCRTFLSVCNQPPKANSAFHPSGVGKWVPASAGKAKAGMVHSVSGWSRGVQVKLWNPLRTRAIPERLVRCVHDEALYKSTFTFTFTCHLQTLLRLQDFRSEWGANFFFWITRGTEIRAPPPLNTPLDVNNKLLAFD